MAQQRNSRAARPGHRELASRASTARATGSSTQEWVRRTLSAARSVLATGTGVTVRITVAKGSAEADSLRQAARATLAQHGFLVDSCIVGTVERFTIRDAAARGTVVGHARSPQAAMGPTAGSRLPWPLRMVLR